jgi:hypothetical protein
MPQAWLHFHLAAACIVALQVGVSMQPAVLLLLFVYSCVEQVSLCHPDQCLVFDWHLAVAAAELAQSTLGHPMHTTHSYKRMHYQTCIPASSTSKSN